MNCQGNFNKVILVGASNAGKTCIANRIANDVFCDDSNSTIGCVQFNVDIKHEDNKIKFTLWDTAGQEKYRSLIPSYTRDTKIVLLVFDLSHSDPLQQIEEWYKYLIQKLDCDPYIILIGNKSDLGVSMDKKKLSDFCNHLINDIDSNSKITHKIEYMEVSAKTKDSISSLLDLIGKHLFDIDQENFKNQKETEPSINLIDNNHGKKGCC